MPSSDVFTDWVREHAIPFETLDPAAPLDDLEPLRDLVGTARVVAVGENSHYVREFSLLRDRITRFLVERCGFTMVALESGFSEGFAIDDWMRGAGQVEDLDALLERCVPVGLGRPEEVQASLRWVREHNASGARTVRYTGIDVPEAAGSLLPALRPLGAYLENVDPHGLLLLEAALAIADPIACTSMAKAGPLYAALDPARQDRLTALLSRLLNRMQAMQPLYVEAGGALACDTAVWRLQAAIHSDHQLRGMGDLMTVGKETPGAMTARDLYMAESVRWVLDHADPDARIVMAVHNAHIQTTPVVYDGEFHMLPMGHHLQRLFGADYVAIGATCTGGRTAEMRPDGEGVFGFTAFDVPLEPARPGSVEAALSAAGLGLAMVPLAAVPAELAASEAAPDSVRLDTGYMDAAVVEAFDVLVHIPQTTVAERRGF